MNQFDPDIPGLLEGDITSVAVTDPQPFVGGIGNHVIDPTKPFTLGIEWVLQGQLVPLWLAALGGNWDVSVYAESLGGGTEARLGSASVSAASGTPTGGVNGTKFTATITVGPGSLQEHTPGTDVGGIYKLVVAVFLNSNLLGVPGYDLVGFSEGPIIQAENPV
jgi:hypothetical protein